VIKTIGGIKIVKFEPWHLEWIDFNEDAKRAVEYLLKEHPNHGVLLSSSSNAFTAMYKGKVLGSAGLIPWWQGMCELWMYLGVDAFDNRRGALKLVSWAMEHVIETMELNRIQATVKTDYVQGHRFAKFFGFVNEGEMKNYGPNKESFTRYAKIL
jgi:RimJ/RimL family protein N-acetyltransferase